MGDRPKGARVRKRCSSRHGDTEVAIASRQQGLNLTRGVQTEEVALEGISIYKGQLKSWALKNFPRGCVQRGREED